MKSLLLRLSALSVVVVLGLIVVAHAQHRSAPGDQAAATAISTDAAAVSDAAANADDPPRPFVPDTSMRVLSIESRRTDTQGRAMQTAAASAETAPADPFKTQNAGPPRIAESAAVAYVGSNSLRSEPGIIGEITLDGAKPNDVRHPVNLLPAADARASQRLETQVAMNPTADEPRLISPQVNADSGATELRPLGSANKYGSNAPTVPESTASLPVDVRPLSIAAPAEENLAANQAGVEGSGKPGARQLEGIQSPQLTIEKIAPPEVQVGRLAKFEIRVHNIGTAVAEGVEIHDQVPQGAKFISSNPLATTGPNGQLTWSLGTLKPGDKASVQLELMPLAEGELGSVASVSLRAEASVRTVATRARLVVELSAPKQVMIGADATVTVRISNPGTGTATGVVLLERVPEGTRHPAGSSLEFDVGALKQGASRQIELSLTAAKAGHVVNLLKARAEGNVSAEGRAEFDIVAPGLAVTMTGPTRRYLERQATYVVSVTNPGTAPAKDVELTTQLPKGMKFIQANNAGHYDPQTHTVRWSLEELPPTETGRVTLVAMPIEVGEQTVKIEGKAKQGLSDEKQQTVTVEGLAAVECDIRGTDDAIEVGGETTYQIHVVNQGSKAAENLRVSAIFPPEMKVLRVEGTGHPAIDDHRVDFEPLAQLAPKAEATFRVRAQALQAGDLRVKMQLQSDDMRQPVNKEESTRVYVDH
jgi:uncharacterized repeat protein (TIGR01451 family)